MPDVLNNREGPQVREPSKCLNRWRYRERQPKWPSDHHLQEAQKKHSDRAIIPVMEAVPASLHTWRHQGPHKANSCITFTLNSHWGRGVTGKKSPASMHTGLLWLYPTLQLCGLPGFSVRERGSLGKNTRAYCPILVAIQF